MSPHPDARLTLVLRPPARDGLDGRRRACARRLWLLLRALVLTPFAALRWPRRRPPPAGRVRRILVIRTDRLGDMALSTGALIDLRAHFARAEITVLAPAAPLELLRGHPAVDRLVPLDSRRLPAALRRHFDLAIDLTPDERLRGAHLAAQSAARFRAGFAGAGRQALFTLPGPHVRPPRPMATMYRELLSALGVPGAAAPALHVTPGERGAAQARLGGMGAAAPRVAVHPGGHYPSQRWAPERFAEVIGALTVRAGAACVVIASPGEESLARRIAAVTPDALLWPAGTVREMMALLACCDLFVGNNSGPLHIAGALGLPTVSVIGPTDPRRFSPAGPADQVVRHALPCAPCNRDRCWHHTCLRAIEPEEVVALALAALRRRLPQREAR